MSAVIAFTPTRSRESRGPASIVSIDTARARQSGPPGDAAVSRRSAMANHPSMAGRPGVQAARDPRLVAVDVDWSRVAPARPQPLRLTRRGRVIAGLVASVLLLVALAAAVVVIGGPANADEQAQPVPVTYHVVMPGETLWSIAGQVAPRADRRDTVSQLAEFNALGSAGVQAGQRLAIPGGL